MLTPTIYRCSLLTVRGMKAVLSTVGVTVSFLLASQDLRLMALTLSSMAAQRASLSSKKTPDMTALRKRSS